MNKAHIHNCVSVRMFYKISLKLIKCSKFGRLEIQDRRPNEKTVISYTARLRVGEVKCIFGWIYMQENLQKLERGLNESTHYGKNNQPCTRSAKTNVNLPLINDS
jgi:hypothetical protein